MKSDVTFNSGGVSLAGNLYTPDSVGSDVYPAVVVGHPAGGVKEQTAGLYASHLAQHGFITLTFDTATQGESEGQPRGVEDPCRRVEEFRDAVSFLSVHEKVDLQKIGILGICASGGYVIPAAATDLRIKAVATVSGVDLGAWYRVGADGKQPNAVLQGLLESAAAARTAEARGGKPEMMQIHPSTREQAIAAGTMVFEGWEYYCTDRAQNPRAAKAFTKSCIDNITSFEAFGLIEMIAPRPLLAIVGTKAITKWMAEGALVNAKSPKELFWIDGASHVDLYDKPQYVPLAVEKLADFFSTHLRASS